MANFLNRFSRITTQGRTFLPHIDGLRFVAIVSVIAYHVWQLVPFHYGITVYNTGGHGDLADDLFSSGCLGVQLFFAISGFILVLPFARRHLHQGRPVRLRDYFLRRVTRLEPPYIIHLLFLFVLCCTLYRLTPTRPLFSQNPEWFDYTWRHLSASLFYQNGLIYGIHPEPNHVLWSLEVEIQFYVLAPFLAWIFRPAGAGSRRLLMMGLIILVPIILEPVMDPYLFAFSLAGNLQYFLVGFLWCELFLTDWNASPARGWRWDLLWLPGIFLLALRAYIPNFFWLLPWIIYGLGLAAFRGRLTGRILSNPWIMTVGGMCYTIYLYHWLMISGLIRLTHPLHGNTMCQTVLIQFLVMSPIIIGICGILFILFERPFMQRDWPARLRSVFRKAPAAVPQDRVDGA